MTVKPESEQKPKLGASGIVSACLLALSGPAVGGEADSANGGGGPVLGRDERDGMGDERKDSVEIDETALKLAKLDTNDFGFARRLAAYENLEVQYCGQVGWLAWDGCRYNGDDGLAITRQRTIALGDRIKFGEYKALMLARPKRPEGDPDDYSDEDKKAVSEKARLTKQGAALWKAAVQIGNSSKQTSVLDTAAQLPEFRVRFEDLDKSGFLLNAANGVLDLEMAECLADLESPSPAGLRPPVPEDRFTRVLAVPFKPAAKSPVWDAHLERIMPGDAPMQKYLMRILGSLLVAYNPRNKLILLQGQGGDGKSTTINAVVNILADYAQSADIKTFLHDARPGGSGPSPDMARMAGGARLIRTGEPAPGAQLAEDKIKQATGGEPMVARNLHAGQFEFMPQFKLIIQCNSKPTIKGDDRGIWRRFEMVQFKEFITPIDTSIDAKLAAEASGILNCLLEGYFDWKALDHDYDAPQSALDALAEYKTIGNSFAAWYEDRIMPGRWWPIPAKQARIVPLVPEDDGIVYNYNNKAIKPTNDAAWQPRYSAAEIYGDYKAWCEGSDIKPMANNTIGKKFSEKDHPEKKSGGKRYRVGFDFVDGCPQTPKEKGDRRD